MLESSGNLSEGITPTERRVIDEGYPLTLDNFSTVYQEAIDVLTEKLNNISVSLNDIVSKRRTLESVDTTDLTQRYEQRR